MLPTHSYLSTACQHDLHAQCRQTCKFCGVYCLCPCHRIPTLDQLQSIDRKLDQVLALSQRMYRQEVVVTQELVDLTAQVESNRSLTGSAITLLNGLSAKLTAIADDPAAIRALAADLKTQDQALADALAANTPAEPAAGGGTT